MRKPTVTSHGETKARVMLARIADTRLHAAALSCGELPARVDRHCLKSDDWQRLLRERTSLASAANMPHSYFARKPRGFTSTAVVIDTVFYNRISFVPLLPPVMPFPLHLCGAQTGGSSEGRRAGLVRAGGCLPCSRLA